MYFSDASSPIGNSSAVITTMKRLMPSTPTMYRDAERRDPRVVLDELEAGDAGLEVPEQPEREAERDHGRST